MSMEPVRLRVLDDADASLREDLSRVAADDVGYDALAGAARFEAGLAAGLPLPADPASASTGLLAWIAGGAGVVGVAAIAWAVGRGPSNDVPTKPVATETSAEVMPAVERAPIREPQPPPPAIVVPPPITDEPIVDAPITEPAPKPLRKVDPRNRPAPTPAPDDDRLRREMAATDAADKALATDPARALELVRAADRHFEGGMFAEDRDGITALAKLQLGKGDAAARAYLGAHPKGTYAQRLRRALEDQGE